MTLEALMTATALEPTVRPSSSMAAFVIDEDGFLVGLEEISPEGEE